MEKTPRENEAGEKTEGWSSLLLSTMIRRACFTHSPYQSEEEEEARKRPPTAANKKKGGGGDDA